MLVGFDPVVPPEQPSQARMADRDVEAVRIIVGDRLPVELTRADRDAPDNPQILEPIRRHLVLVGRHHLRNRWRSGFKRNEEKPPPPFEYHRKEPELLCLE